MPMRAALLSLGLVLAGLAANVWLFWLGPPPLTVPEAGHLRVAIAGRMLEIPRAYLRPGGDARGGRVDLVVKLADFTPPDTDQTEEKRPDLLFLTLRPGDDSPDIGTMLQTVYARFLSGERATHPAGLSVHFFRAGTPYEDRALYIGAGGVPFLALCPKAVDFEPCLSKLRFEAIDLDLRFSPAKLDEWRRFVPMTVQFVAYLAAQGQRIPVP